MVLYTVERFDCFRDLRVWGRHIPAMRDFDAAKDLEALSSKLQKPQMDRGSRCSTFWIRSEVQVLGPRVSAVRGCHAFSIPKQSFLPERFAAAYPCFEVEGIVPNCEAVVWYLFCQDSVGSYKGFAGLLLWETPSFAMIL